ncbi:hypothetical protein BD410DRAFT_846385 [Rickenella mellea]|uniref:Uncharacterized protein n=1 Tax=Rickenella mellea TaxID=50990 RepID=A0A4Y7PFS8_9AGAM|nr:hypothetical protein BD410DRAFT_846385 [Rickenella mellea]
MNAPVLLTGLRYKDCAVPGVYEAIVPLMLASYACNDTRKFHYTQQLTMGNNIFPDVLRAHAHYMDAVAFLKSNPHAGWLGVVKTHSHTTLGGLLTMEFETDDGEKIENEFQLVSEALPYWFGRPILDLISGSSGVRHPRTLVLQVCGPVVSVEKSRKDMEQLILDDVLDAIVALSRDFVTPELLTPPLSTFCNNLYTLTDIYDVTPTARVIRALELAFGNQVHVLQHTAVVLIAKGGDGVETTAFAHGPPQTRPWGIPVPVCGLCGRNASILVDSQDKTFYFDEQVSIEGEKGDKVSVVMTKKTKYKCFSCGAQARVARPDDVNVWRSPWLRHHYTYPYPTTIDATWEKPNQVTAEDAEMSDAATPNTTKPAPKKSKRY